MNFRLVISDIDGTLVTDEGILLQSTQQAVDSLARKGILFATASARTISKTHELPESTRQQCAAAAYVNGCYVVARSGAVLEDAWMPRQPVMTALRVLDSIQASYCLISTEDAIAFIRHGDCREVFGLYHSSFRETHEPIPDGFRAYMIVVYGEMAALNGIQGPLSGLSNFVEVSAVASSQEIDLACMYLQPPGINKGSALMKIAQHLGVPAGQILAIGDGASNDAPMLQMAGIPVAMKNASNALKRIAKHITQFDNNSNGLGRFLEGFLDI